VRLKRKMGTGLTLGMEVKILVCWYEEVRWEMEMRDWFCRY